VVQLAGWRTRSGPVVAMQGPDDPGDRPVEPGADASGPRGVELPDHPGTILPAGVGARCVAGVIDIAIVVAALAPVPQPFPPLLVLLVFVGYHWLLTWWVGRTVGKALLGLRVLRLDGPVSWWWALGRSGPGYLVLSVAGLGWLTATRDAYRRPLYDILLGGVVVQDVDPAGTSSGLADRLLVYAREHKEAVAARKEPLGLVAGLWAALTKGTEWAAKGLQFVRGEPTAVSSGTSLSSWATGQAAAAVSAAGSVAAVAVVAVVPGSDGLGQWLMSDRHWSPQPASIQEFVVAIGDTIEPGRPAAGAGTLSVDGEQDHLRFAGGAGQQVVFDVTSLGGDGDECGDWHVTLGLLDPAGDRQDEALAWNKGCRAYGPFELASDGTYTVLVEGGDGSWGATTGTYQFRLLATDDPVEDIEIGPGSLAGRIDIPRSTVAYRFAGRAGQQVVFDVTSLGGDGDECGDWHVTLGLLDPAGDRQDEALAWNKGCRAYGPFELASDGTYTVLVEGGDGSWGATTGTYQFRLLESIP
jgi:uncharacterized RDD family membrane protein YckC